MDGKKLRKIEKGPLQRFKNQNTVVKKFGKMGLKVYKAITGNITSEELQEKLKIPEEKFQEIIEFMLTKKIVEYVDSEKSVEEKQKKPKKKEDKKPTEEEKAEIEEEPEPPKPKSEPTRKLKEEPTKVMKPKAKKEKQKKEEVVEEEFGEIDIPEPSLEPESFIENEEPEPLKKQAEVVEEEFGEITLPGEDEPELPTKQEKESVKEEIKEEQKSMDELEPLEFDDELGPDFGEIPDENKEMKKIEKEEVKEELEPLEFEDEGKEEEWFDIEPEAPPPEEPLGSVEQTIKKKFGERGLKVYSLIDGIRTSEQIMREAGVTEEELVEILDFMDEEGIIKLDYPKAKQPQSEFKRAEPTTTTKKKEEKSPFTPILEEEEKLEVVTIASPIEIPELVEKDLIKTIKMKTQLLLKFGDKGKKLLDKIDGKKDVIELCLDLDIPLPKLKQMLEMLTEEGMITMNPVPREEVRKRYGYDGYAVYKKFGKEGVLLYELIGKDLSLKEMAEKVTDKKEEIIDMFIFIHQVLGIELPLDKEMLKKQLGI